MQSKGSAWWNVGLITFSADRLANFDVRVIKKGMSQGQVCYHQNRPVGLGQWLRRTCGQPLVGERVTIQIMGPTPFRGQQVLSLCEVQVWAQQGKFKRSDN